MKYIYILIIIFLATNLFSDNLLKDRDRKEIEIVANKGNSYYLPENTLISFKNAINIGANIKSEIRLTEDNIPIFLTDDYIDRTSNGIGLVKDKTLLELKGYNFGYKEKFADKYNEKILTLDEALKINKSTKFYLEIKDLEAVDPIKNVIKNNDYNKSNIIFIIDKIEDNEDFLKSLKGYKLYYSTNLQEYLQIKEKENFFKELKKKSIKGLCINYDTFINIDKIQRDVFLVIASKYKIPIELNTINNSNDLQNIMDYQVKGVIHKKTYYGKISIIRTDVPEKAILFTGRKIKL